MSAPAILPPAALRQHPNTWPAVPACLFTDFARVEALLNRVDALEFELDQARSRAEELADTLRMLEANR